MIIEKLFPVILREVEITLEQDLIKENLSAIFIKTKFESLIHKMNRILSEVITSKSFLEKNKHLKDIKIGDSFLYQYYRDNAEEEIENTWDSDENLLLVIKVLKGNNNAFDTLYLEYEKRIKGRSRILSFSDVDTQEITQNTRIDVWENFKNYNPSFSRFFVFVRFREKYIRLRYYSNKEKKSTISIDQESENKKKMVLQNTDTIFGKQTKAIIDFYEELLPETFGGPCPPHQLLAFGFCKLLDTPPRNFVEKYSNCNLNLILNDLEIEYITACRYYKDDINQAFFLLKEKMNLPFEKVIKNKRTRSLFPHLKKRIVGTTKLRDYFKVNSKPEEKVVQWWDTVRRHMMQILITSGKIDRYRELLYSKS